MEKFDRIYIGTGPISVTDALHHKAKSARILMIDDKNQVGGAWVAIPVGQYGDLEVGCHIWSYNKEVYQFLEKFYQLDLIDLKPQPYFLRGRTRISYDQKHGVTTLKQIGKYLKKARLGQAINYMRKDPSARFPIIAKKYRYPQGGARDLQQALVKRIDRAEIGIQLSTTVEKMNFENNEWQLMLSNGSEVKSKEVVLTATTSVRTIEANGKTLELNHKPLNYTHFHLVVKGKPKKPCSYVRVLNHPIIHRLSEVTYQLEHEQKEPVTVYLIGVFDKTLPKDMSEGEMADELHHYLIGQGYIQSENELIYQQINRFETTYIERSQRPSVAELPQLKLLATTDLIYGFHTYLKDWATT